MRNLLILLSFVLSGCQSTTENFLNSFANNSSDDACLSMVQEPGLANSASNVLKIGGSLLGDWLVNKKEPTLEELKLRLKADVVLLPWSVEQELGKLHVNSWKAQQIIADSESEETYIESYARVNKVLNDLLANVPKEIRDEYNFKIYVKSAHVNKFDAEVLPGGVIIVTLHAADISSDDALTFLIAHELAHIFKRHTVLRYQDALIDAVETKEDLEKLFSKSSKDVLRKTVQKLIKRGKTLIHYKRDDEDEADLCGLSHMYQIPGTNSIKGINDFIAEIEHTQPSKEHLTDTWFSMRDHRDSADRKAYLLESREKIANAIRERKQATP